MTTRHVAMALIAVAVIAALFVRRGSDVDESTPATPSSETAIAALPANTSIDAHDDARPVAAPADMDTDPILDSFVDRKYRFLLAGLHQSVPANTLDHLLRERERAAVAINTARQSSDPSMHGEIARHEVALVQADLRIRALLHPEDYAAYEALRDSDVERFQLEDYAGGIRLVAPLSETEERAILLSKLNHKKAFRQILLDSGLLNADLSTEQRKQAYNSVSAALEQYRDNYLAEARQYLLDDEQYTLLRNYESAEFAAELAMLRSMAGEG